MEIVLHEKQQQQLNPNEKHCFVAVTNENFLILYAILIGIITVQLLWHSSLFYSQTTFLFVVHPILDIHICTSIVVLLSSYIFVIIIYCSIIIFHFLLSISVCENNRIECVVMVPSEFHQFHIYAETSK